MDGRKLSRLAVPVFQTKSSDRWSEQLTPGAFWTWHCVAARSGGSLYHGAARSGLRLLLRKMCRWRIRISVAGSVSGWPCWTALMPKPTRQPMSNPFDSPQFRKLLESARQMQARCFFCQASRSAGPRRRCTPATASRWMWILFLPCCANVLMKWRTFVRHGGVSDRPGAATGADFRPTRRR